MRTLIQLNLAMMFSLLYRSIFVLCVTILTLIEVSSEALAQAGSNRIGGDAGNQFNQTCPRDKYAVGIMFWDDRNVIHQLQLVCAAADPDTGRAIRNTQQNSPRSPDTRPGGSRWLHRGEQFCPDGSFISAGVSGFVGQFFQWRVVSGLEFNCIRFSNIDNVAGTSDVRQTSRERIGARFAGRRYISDGHVAFGGVISGDTALNGFVLRTGGALDSVEARAKTMPWVGPPPSSSRRMPGISTGRPVTVSLPPTNTGRPDLFIGPQVSLYRVDKSGRVPNQFCTQSTVQSNFPLPSLIKFAVFNAGEVRSPQTQVRIRFGNRVSVQNVPPLEPGAGEDMFFERGDVRRCLNKINGRCSECLKQAPYNDPTIELFVDPNNLVNELSEVNNRRRF